jgi:hypothetical protein
VVENVSAPLHTSVNGKSMRLVYRPDHPQANPNGLVDIGLIEARSSDPHFSVISDTMDPLRHMATGKMHTSKTAFRADTKAAGCIEYGNDAPTKPRARIPLSREQRRNDIKQAIYEIRNGRRP